MARGADGHFMGSDQSESIRDGGVIKGRVRPRRLVVAGQTRRGESSPVLGVIIRFVTRQTVFIRGRLGREDQSVARSSRKAT